MNQSAVTAARQHLLRRLPNLALLLRGSLLERTIRHRRGCPKCAAGGGHPALVLGVGYPGGRTRQISLRPELKPRVQQWLDNYHQVKTILEAICELNHHLLRPEAEQAAEKPPRPAGQPGGRRG